jgi:hypothetical protein
MWHQTKVCISDAWSSILDEEPLKSFNFPKFFTLFSDYLIGREMNVTIVHQAQKMKIHCIGLTHYNASTLL